MKRIAFALMLLPLTTAGALAADADLPRPPELEPAIQFWTRVYSEVTTNAGLIHDRDNLDVVYEVMHFDDDTTRRRRAAQVRARKRHYRELLLELASTNRETISPQAREVLKLWPSGVSDRRLRQAAHSIRFQLGQADKFRAGLVRSGAWEPYIRRTLKEMGLPEELAALPHVESSFNPDAWSRVGAAGLWQFTRSTGQRYMRIDHVVDERMDPFRSTIAAARLLQHNYSVTEDWALAITAYNHGLAGVRRAAHKIGTKDIGKIVQQYDGRRWGFASRNFYAAFLAAVDVDFHAEKYFGDVQRNNPLVTETVELPFFAPADELADAFDVDVATLRRLNRGLREPVWNGDKRVPRGYALRLPAGPHRDQPTQLLASVDQDARYFDQVPDRFHRVQRGEALSTIARRYGVSTHELVALNNLRSRNFIRAGQRLRLPVPADSEARVSDGTYTVRRGDTLSRIALRVGLSVGDIAAANGLGDGHTIYPGQELRVDGRAAADVDTVAEAETDAATNEASESDDTGGADQQPATETVVAMADEPDDGTASDAADSPVAAVNDGGEAPGTVAAPADGEVAPGDAAATSEGDTDMAADMPQPKVSDDSLDSEVAMADQPGTAPADDDPVEPQPDLSADPSDYQVADDDTIEVQAAETLGHYAEWLDLRASQLRRINDMRYGTPVVIGNRLALDFSNVDPATFEKRRQAYHESLQARFFDQFRIAGTKKVLVQRGDSLWTLARRADNVPVWLLRQYNPDLDFTALQPGMPVTLPQVERQPQTDNDSGSKRAEAAGTDGASDV